MTLKLKYSRRLFGARLKPWCESSQVNHDGISLISCLLTDDGGLELISSLEWIDIGLEWVASALATGTFADWARETWGAKISRDKTEIYFLHDEAYIEILDTKSFEIALKLWRDFIGTPADPEYMIEVEI